MGEAPTRKDKENGSAATGPRPALRWRVGDVIITRVPEYEWLAEPGQFFTAASLGALTDQPWLFPDFVTTDGKLRLSCHALLVETPQIRVIVDTCYGENKNLPHLASLDHQGAFLDGLADAGFTRENVDFVLCTHLHIDHVGWNTMWDGSRWIPTFPKARYLIGTSEYRHLHGDDTNPASLAAPMVFRESIEPLIEAGLVDFVETDHRLSPEICLTPTPGHTPGHVSVLISSKDERAVITGDMCHHPCQIAYPHWHNRYDTDPEIAVDSRERMLEHWAASGPLVIGTHFPPPSAGRIVEREGRKRLLC